MRILTEHFNYFVLLPLLSPFCSRSIVHSSMLPKGLKIMRTSCSDDLRDNMPTNNLRSSAARKTKKAMQINIFGKYIEYSYIWMRTSCSDDFLDNMPTNNLRSSAARKTKQGHANQYVREIHIHVWNIYALQTLESFAKEIVFGLTVSSIWYM